MTDEAKILVKDRSVPRNAGTSRFLTKEEMHKLYPHNYHVQRTDVVFRHGKAEAVPKKIGYALIQKYDAVVRVDAKNNILSQKDDLEDMKYQDMKSLAMRYGISHRDTNVKHEELADMIRQCRELEIVPITEDEWERRKEQGTTTDFTMPFEELLKQAEAE